MPPSAAYAIPVLLRLCSVSVAPQRGQAMIWVANNPPRPDAGGGAMP